MSFFLIINTRLDITAKRTAILVTKVEIKIKKKVADRL